MTNKNAKMKYIADFAVRHHTLIFLIMYKYSSKIKSVRKVATPKFCQFQSSEKSATKHSVLRLRTISLINSVYTGTETTMPL